jgi:hypothetical protein
MWVGERSGMKMNLRMKCSYCGHWNKVPAIKVFFEPDSTEPKVKVMIPMYQPVQTSKCEKCGKTTAEPKMLIRIVHGKAELWKQKK